MLAHRIMLRTAPTWVARRCGATSGVTLSLGVVRSDLR